MPIGSIREPATPVLVLAASIAPGPFPQAPILPLATRPLYLPAAVPSIVASLPPTIPAAGPSWGQSVT
jgi:hypothetical protein